MVVNNDNKEELIKQIVNKIKIKASDIKDIKISKKSLDARNKPDLFYVYEVDVSVINEKLVLFL